MSILLAPSVISSSKVIGEPGDAQAGSPVFVVPQLQRLLIDEQTVIDGPRRVGVIPLHHLDRLRIHVDRGRDRGKGIDLKPIPDPRAVTIARSVPDSIECRSLIGPEFWSKASNASCSSLAISQLPVSSMAIQISRGWSVIGRARPQVDRGHALPRLPPTKRHIGTVMVS
jgi:hypothetical protein